MNSPDHPFFAAVKDSGERQEFATGSVRDTDVGKGAFDQIPTGPLRRLAVHFENGARKYGRDNWLKGQPLSRYYSSAFRHLLALKEGKMDEDHAAAAAWNVFAFMETAARVNAGKLPAELDDLGFYAPPAAKITFSHVPETEDLERE